MQWQKRWLWASVCGLGIGGCVSGPTGMGSNHHGALADDLDEPTASRTVARSQRPDGPGLPPAGPPSAPASPPTSITNATYRVNVGAWVNGKPLFEEEIFQGLPRQVILQVQSLPEPLRTQKQNEWIQRQRETVIDQELMYQDAVSKLEKANPRALEKIRAFAHQEFQKQITARLKDSNVSEVELQQYSKLLQRINERQFISTEYVRSRIFPLLERATRHDVLKAWYDEHKNEFLKVETVEWQHVFIPAEKHGGLGPARRHAEELIQTCRTADDFQKLLQYDEGTAKFNNGKGLGSRRGEIKPPEVEAHLFNLRDGEIGPVVEISTGVHLFRLLKRDPGGYIPFNETTQKQIRDKIRNEVAEQEMKKIVRDLRSRAVIEYE